MTSNDSRPSSTPPGARGSARTMPVTRTVDSCVASSTPRQVSVDAESKSFVRGLHLQLSGPERSKTRRRLDAARKIVRQKPRQGDPGHMRQPVDGEASLLESIARRFNAEAGEIVRIVRDH